MYSAPPRFSPLESEPIKPKKALKLLRGFLAAHASEPAEEGLEAAPGKLSLDEATRLREVGEAIQAMVGADDETEAGREPAAAAAVAETPKQHKKKRSSDEDEETAEEAPTTTKKKKKAKAKLEAEQAAVEEPTTQKKKKKKHSVGST